MEAKDKLAAHMPAEQQEAAEEAGQVKKKPAAHM